MVAKSESPVENAGPSYSLQGCNHPVDAGFRNHPQFLNHH